MRALARRLNEIGKIRIGCQVPIERGKNAGKPRPCNISWLRGIVQQCEASQVACFVKQLGNNVCPDNRLWPEKSRMQLRDSKGADPSEWPADLRVQQYSPQEVLLTATGV